MSLSYCQKCGSKFETRGFKCPNCGALLANVPQPKRRGPSLWDKIRPYRSYLILLAIAIVIASTRAVLALTTIYWVLLIGLLVAVAVLYLRGRNRGQTYGRPPYGPTRGSGTYGPRGRYGNPGSPGPSAGPQKKHGNVIPFRKKRDSKQNDAKGQ
jgi:hypothetical protein